MGTNSRLIEVLPGQMRQIAQRLKTRREALGITQDELARRCNQAAEALFGPEDRMHAGRMSRSRIAHIEQAHRPRPGKGAAMALHPHEIRILASALEVSPEQIVADHDGGIVAWDPLTNPQRAAHFSSLLKSFERGARELLGWAEFLPCSLETPEFMHAHHRAIFNADALDLPETERAEWSGAAIAMYDAIGGQRRQALLSSGASRPWAMTHMMLRPDLERIACGEGAFAGIAAASRRACLRNLRRLVADRSLRIDLVILPEEAGLRHLVQGFDSLVVLDESFAFWRSFSGDIAYTAHPSIVRLRRALLETLRGQAQQSRPDDIIDLLDQLTATVVEAPRGRGPEKRPDAARKIGARPMVHAASARRPEGR
ncbi:MAG TPA: helix-turn-helix transcriptional regulator [Candidatus Polarisedimenticolia bacterium]